MKVLTTYLTCISIIIALYGCSGNTDTAIPRRTAYPRIATYDSTFVTLSDLPVNIIVNKGIGTSMSVNDDGSIWLNMTYDKHHVTVYCTITPVDDSSIEAVLDNRSERINRNLGSSKPLIEDIPNNNGYVANLVTDLNVSTTPVQFIAYNSDNKRWVVSGSAFLDNASSITSADSIKPVVQMLKRDMSVLLQALSDN